MGGEPVTITACEARSGWLVITREDHSISLVPFEAVASWSELLGSADPAEVAEAIEHVSAHGEPEGVWADAYAILTHREQAREAEALRAHEEGTAEDPRSPALRSALAAYRAVHVPITADGDCLADLCRRSVRDQLGVSEPPRRRGSASRSVAPQIDTDHQGGTAILADALRGHESELLGCTQRFLHSLTGGEEDPLTPDDPAPPVSDDPDDPLADLRRKYHPEADS